MNKKFIINLALLLFVNVLVKPFYIFGIDRNVQLAVGETDFGIYFALFNLSVLLNIILDFGINNFNNRNISQHNYLLTKHFSGIVAIKFLLGIAYSVVTVVVALAVGYKGEQLYFLYFLIFNQFLSSFILYIRSNIAALQLFKTDSIMSIVDRLIMIFICSYLLWGNVTNSEFKIEWFIYSQTVAYILTLIIGILIIYQKIDSFRISLNLVFSWAILKKSFPYALLIFLMSCYTRIDSVMLERLLPDGAFQAGIYAKGFRILEAVNMIGFLFAVLLLPIFSYMIKRKENVEELVKISIMLLIIPSFILATGCFFFRFEIMQLLYNSSDSYNANVFGILIFGFISFGASYIFGTLLTANGSLKQLNIISGFALLLNIVLNLILIPRYQALGSASVCVIVQTFPVILQIIIVSKIFKFKVTNLSIIKAVFFIAILFGCGILTDNYKVFFPFDWYWLFAIYGVVMLAIATLLKLFKIRGLFQIVSFKGRNS